jgi:hypothetical protein
MGGFVAFAVENPVGRRISAVNDGSLVDLTTRGNGAKNQRLSATDSFIGIEAAVVRAGPEAPPATTRGGAV